MNAFLKSFDLNNPKDVALLEKVRADTQLAYEENIEAVIDERLEGLLDSDILELYIESKYTELAGDERYDLHPPEAYLTEIADRLEEIEEWNLMQQQQPITFLDSFDLNNPKDVELLEKVKADSIRTFQASISAEIAEDIVKLTHSKFAKAYVERIRASQQNDE